MAYALKVTIVHLVLVSQDHALLENIVTKLDYQPQLEIVLRDIIVLQELLNINLQQKALMEEQLVLLDFIVLRVLLHLYLALQEPTMETTLQLLFQVALPALQVCTVNQAH